MTDILRRDMAPISPDAWAEIDDQAVRTLRGNLSARGLIDVDGPQGWNKAAVNLGSVDTNNKKPIDGVNWGMREVLPLMELRVPFSLDIWDLDNISRGGKTPELDAVAEAAAKLAKFEENAIYYGFEQACIVGIAQASSHDAVSLPDKPDEFIKVIEKAIVQLQKSGIGGPYALVLGSGPFETLFGGDQHGYPLRKRIEDLKVESVLWSPAVEKGLLLSTRGGDYEMTLGQDASIGYQHSADGKVHLYLTESFTFRPLEPAAAISLK